MEADRPRNRRYRRAMRCRLILLASLLCASPALAGQRAVYADADGKKLTIEITDDGNAVVRPEEQDQYGVLRDGHFYLVAREKDQWSVARMEDLAAAIDRVMPPIFRQLFDMAAKDKPKSKLKIEPAGKRTIAGHEGQVYKVYGLDEEKPKEATEMVLTKEPAIEPVGRAMEQFTISTVVMMAPLIGQAAADMVSDMRAVFAYGAPLDMGRFKLLSIEQAAIAPAAATLPAKPDTVDQIIASMKTSNIQPN